MLIFGEGVKNCINIFMVVLRIRSHSAMLTLCSKEKGWLVLCPAMVILHSHSKEEARLVQLFLHSDFCLCSLHLRWRRFENGHMSGKFGVDLFSSTHSFYCITSPSYFIQVSSFMARYCSFSSIATKFIIRDLWINHCLGYMLVDHV